MSNSRFRYRTSHLCGLAIACIIAALPVARAQQIPPGELVRVAIQNEINDGATRSKLFTWKERQFREHIPQLENIVDTPSGAVSRVLLIDNKPLSPKQRSEEDARIRRMLDPAQMRRKLKEQREDDERTRKMLTAIPDAFNFSYLDTITAPNGHKLTHIRFTARPGFDPPTRESAVFTGMQGEMLVDETARRLAKIDGTLFRDVTFGWGVLGKLYKGGRFVVEQSEVAPSHWDTTRMILHFDGKALLVKSIHIDENETSWDYKPVPPMSVEQAMQFLTHEPAQNAMLAP